MLGSVHTRDESMDAYSSEGSLSYSDSPPVLIVGSTMDAIERARSTISSFGCRVGAMLSLAEACERVQQQGRASALWLELDEHTERNIPADLLSTINADVRDGRYGVIVAAPAALIDPLASALDDEVQLVVDASPAERAAALAVALATGRDQARIGDIASDRNADRLRQLSDEVSRIAATLSRLSTGPGGATPVIQQPATPDAPAVSAETVRSVIRARRLRARYFQEEMFADPAWDMLLDLLQAEIAHLRVPVSSLCIAAAVPATTALRWLKTMVSQGLFIRRADEHDGRRVFVELAPEASRALRRYFAEVGSVAVI